MLHNNRYNYITSVKEKITEEGTKYSRYVKTGDFLLSNSMSYGRPYILKTDGYIHDGWLVLRFDEDIILSDYLYYILSSEAVKSQFKSLGIGTTVDNLNKDLVSRVKIPLYGIEEQHYIVKKLSAKTNEIDFLFEEIKDKQDEINNDISKLWFD